MISKIRKYIWVVVVLMALALAGIVIQDMVSGQQSLFGGAPTTLGKVDGEKIDWNDFARTEDLLYSNSTADVYARRNQLWNYFVEDIIVRNEAEALGLGVSKTELLDLQFGVNPSPIIRQRFADPNNPGVLDVQQLNFYKQIIEENRIQEAVQAGQIAPTFTAFWANQEKEIIKERLEAKLATMVAKAIYTPTWMAEMGYKEQSDRVDLAYVRAPFDEIDNSEVALSDADYQAYLEENKARFEQTEETRRVEYVVFDVFPTAADSAANRKVIEDLIPEFQSTTEDSAFVLRNNGAYDNGYYKETELATVITAPEVVDTLFKLSVGTVYGPYVSAGAYQAVKLLDRKVVPDSVKARHILLPAQDAITLATAQARIDSLKGLIQAGTHTFDSLARAFGTDATKLQGGDLGYLAAGGTVKPFNDLIFFEAEPGKLYTVVTQFGVHLVEVTDRKFINNNPGIKLALLNEPIVPSEQTQNAVYEKAQALAGNYRSLDKLEAAVKKNPDLSLETSPLLKANDFTLGTLGTGQTSRDIIRWAFEAKRGVVSPEVYSYQDEVQLFNNKYLVVGLKNVQKAGTPSVESIKADIEQLVVNKKKAELLAQKMKGKQLENLASEFSTQIDTAQNINFSLATLPNVGVEPKVVAEAFAMSKGAMSQPITGNSGVFVVKVLDKRNGEAPSATDLLPVSTLLASSTRSQVQAQLIETLKREAKIRDYRFKFF
ncbi:MAG: peptidylprolyl isomerase [Saprospiraceae bacterium]